LNYPENFLDHAKAEPTFRTLNERLKIDDYKVLLNICSLFDSLSTSASNANVPGASDSLFMTNITSFTDMLLVVVFKPDIPSEHLNIVDKCLSAIVTMSQKCLTGNHFQTTVRKFLDCLANSNTFVNKDRTLLTQEGLLIAITSILWRTSRYFLVCNKKRHNDQVNENYGAGQLPEGAYRIDFDKELASHLYTTVDDMFKMYNKVIPDGLYMLSALSSSKFWLF
jgi:hypothetical protein